MKRRARTLLEKPGSWSPSKPNTMPVDPLPGADVTWQVTQSPGSYSPAQLVRFYLRHLAALVVVLRLRFSGILPKDDY